MDTTPQPSGADHSPPGAVRDILAVIESAKARGGVDAMHKFLHKRFPDSAVSYEKANLLELPDRPVVKRMTRWLAQTASDLLGEDDAMPDAHSLEIAQYYWYVDSTRAENELGWTSRDPMVTLADTVADLRERGVVMMRAPR